MTSYSLSAKSITSKEKSLRPKASTDSTSPSSDSLGGSPYSTEQPRKSNSKPTSLPKTKDAPVSTTAYSEHLAFKCLTPKPLKTTRNRRPSQPLSTSTASSNAIMLPACFLSLPLWVVKRKRKLDAKAL